MSLLPSHRHTRADLEVWNRLERHDGGIAKSSSLAHKESAALAEIAAWHRPGDFVSVSWGKDSVVALHLALRAAPAIRVAWFPAGSIENPDCVRVRDAFLACHPCAYSEIEAGLSSDEWDRTVGHDGAQREFVRASKGFGGRYLCGVRAEESGMRKLSMRLHGRSTGTSCRPIGWWSHVDVFAYLAKHDLPIHPAYACLMGGALERHRIRVGTIGGHGGTGHGRREWERRYYPEMLRA